MAYWTFNFKGKDYKFDGDKQLTLNTLRDIKRANPEIGTYKRFMDAFGEIDQDAIAWVIRISKLAAGEQNVPPVEYMEDFSIVDDFLVDLKFVPDAPDVLDPTQDSENESAQIQD